jgi:DNA-binding SARP family transcriptional activator/tetratricopeptide (TPR) repeat protein
LIDAWSIFQRRWFYYLVMRRVTHRTDALPVWFADQAIARLARFGGDVPRLEYRIMGPLEVLRDGVRVWIGAARQRTLLAALLVHANHVVDTDRLIEYLWDSRPPATARGTVQSLVLRLRRVLEPGRDGGRGDWRVIEARRPGYLIAATTETLDLLRFAKLAAQGRQALIDGRANVAADVLRAALNLWRGPALADVTERLRSEVVPRLTEQQLSALEARVDADLALGRHAELVGELRTLIAEHPLHERLYGQLMRALQRCGRRAEALDVYRTMRRVLVAELGLEPDGDLQRLHQELLGRGPTVVLGPIGDLTRPPSQLPADVPGFVGRVDHLAQLAEVLSTQTTRPVPAPVIAIIGAAGVGKTALAVHWAHRVQTRFPDGTLFVDLRGYDPVGVPVRPDEVLDGFLSALGVPPELVPRSIEERSALLRTLLDHKRMLIVLDNAASSEQVRWLLPGSPGCVVVVTSRNRLAGLTARNGARRLAVDLLSASEALALLRYVIGSRVEIEPAAARELAQLCGHLPLALRLAAERANAHPHRTLAGLTRELRDEYDRLDLLAANDDETTTVRAVFSWSYTALAPAAARMFRLLGLHPGPEVSLSAAAALSATDKRSTGRLLEALTSVHLLQETACDRYRFHDLLRVYARDRAHIDESESDREAALGRVLDWYLRTADAADRLLMPRRRRIPLGPPGTVSEPVEFASVGTALAWCETERENLVAATQHAAVNRLPDVAWKLPFVLWSYFTVRKRWSDWIGTHHLGLTATRRSHDRCGEAHLLTSLANAYRDVGDFPAAFTHFEQAINLSREIGDDWLEGAAQTLLGIAHRDLRHFDAAVICFQAALKIFDALDDPWGRAWALYNLGEASADLRHDSAAIDYTRQALALFRQINDLWGAGWSLSMLAHTYRHLHRFRQASEYCRQALAAARHIGNRQGEALALYTLGKIQYDSGQTTSARGSWHQALAIFEELGAPQATKVRARLEASVTNEM